jgi:hypothetical protein
MRFFQIVLCELCNRLRLVNLLPFAALPVDLFFSGLCLPSKTCTPEDSWLGRPAPEEKQPPIALTALAGTVHSLIHVQ